MERVLVIGGAGFMGSNFVRYLVNLGVSKIVVYDKLTYAGRIENIADLMKRGLVQLVRGDLANEELLEYIVRSTEPELVVNFAAETHVDRSINEPAPFIKTNVVGVFALLEVCRRLDVPQVIHISTDEVYGEILEGSADENHPFRPSSPYSASKAAGDLLCQAYWRTYRLPIKIVRPSNNYGPYQHPEKLIPKTIIRALHNKPIPLYGGGHQVRDWLYVEDFCEALHTIATKGRVGEAYNVPGFNERKNIEVVEKVLEILGKPRTLIKIVEDRPGHDRRYSMKGDKILELGWRPRTPWEIGLRKTVEWYLRNEWWWRPLLSDKYFQLDTPWRG